MEKETFFEYPNYNNIKEMICDSVNKYSDKIAFKIKNNLEGDVTYTDITYKEFLKDINNLGTGLYNLGLQGKKIAIISKNRYEWILSYVSILLGGMIAVPLDKGLTDVELENSLILSKADAIIYDIKYEETIKTIRENKTTNLKECICMDATKEFKDINKIKQDGEKILNGGNTQYVNAKINGKELAVLVFTSGTTSQSKAVMLSQYNIVQNIHDMKLVEDLRSTDVSLAFLPYHHTFGATGQLIELGSGMTTAFPDGLRYIAQNLKEYGVTFFVGVPALVEGIYKNINKEIEKQGKTRLIKVLKIFTNALLKVNIDIRRKVYKQIIDKLGGLRIAISGAASLNKDVQKGLYEFGIETIQGYGLTETSPVIAAENYKYRRYGSIGFPMPSIEVKIVNKNEDGIGELIAKGPNIMLGYYNNEEATNEVLKDGWFYTGDLAYIDKDGYIFITGRKKNMVVLKNGKKIFPEEMEELVNQIDLVEECMVFGMPKGEDLLLSVKIKYDKQVAKERYPELDKEGLRKLIWDKVKEVNKTVPKYKYIKNMILTDEEFIKTTTNKIKRFEEIKKIQGEINEEN